MTLMYKNMETGEVLTYAEAKKQFVEEYDGFDPTNIIQFLDIYRPLDKEQIV